MKYGHRPASKAGKSFPGLNGILCCFKNFFIKLILWIRAGCNGNRCSFPVLFFFDVQSPPFAVAEERRKQAEAVFMEFRKQKSPYNACKFILGGKLCKCLFFNLTSLRGLNHFAKLFILI